jgi:alanine racemase
MRPGSPDRPEAVVDLGAIRHNVLLLAETAAPAALMVVVKADGYGHGLERVAQAAREAGAPWLGVATLDEALALREGGDTGPVLCWLDVPGPDPDRAVRAGIDLTAYTLEELDRLAAAARGAGLRARVQLKVDTGLSRGGCTPADWPALVTRAREREEAGDLVVTGVWSHLACADEPAHPANDAQEAAFREAVDVAQRAGLRPEVRHLANSAATLLRPSARFDLVRCGIAAYGLDPAPEATPRPLADRLVPAMTLQTPLTLAKDVPAGAGVSYGHTWTAPAPTTVGLVPLGYGDGVPWSAGSRGEVWVAGARRPVRGRVCMDQLVVDLGGDRPPAGEPAVLFGTGDGGEPTAQDWAEAAGTINYEIVTRVSGRVPRRYVHPDPADAAEARGRSDAVAGGPGGDA